MVCKLHPDKALELAITGTVRELSLATSVVLPTSGVEGEQYYVDVDTTPEANNAVSSLFRLGSNQPAASTLLPSAENRLRMLISKVEIWTPNRIKSLFDSNFMHTPVEEYDVGYPGVLHPSPDPHDRDENGRPTAYFHTSSGALTVGAPVVITFEMEQIQLSHTQQQNYKGRLKLLKVLCQQ